MLAPTNVAWDEETQEGVVLQPKGSKTFLKKAIEKKTHNLYRFLKIILS